MIATLRRRAAGVQMLRPLRHRDFALLWAGMSVSIVGDGFYQVALAWQVYLLSDAPTALSVVGAASTLPSVVFVLFGGVLADRFERRRVLIVSDALRGASVLWIGVLGTTGGLELSHVIGSSVIYGLGQALFGPAFTALVPDLVPQEELAPATAVDSVVRPLGLNLLGPAVGGVLIAAAGPASAFLFDAASFAISMAALAALHPHPLRPQQRTEAPFSQLAEGLNYVRRHTWLWGTFIAACLSLLCFMGPLRVLVPFVIKNYLGGSASDLGLVFASGGVGSIVGSVAFSQRGLPLRPVLTMFLAWGFAVLAIGGFGFVTNLWQAAVLMLLVQGLSTAGLLIWAVLMATRVPRELLGRVSSLDWMLSVGLVPVSFVATGPVAEAIGVTQTLLLAGVLGGVLFPLFLFLPGLRDGEPALAPGRAR